MPDLRRAWACEWGCGHRVITSRARMVAHELRCFHNPDRRACQTCANYGRYSHTVYNRDHGGNPGSTDYDVWRRYCEADETMNPANGLRCDCQRWAKREV